MVRYPAVVFALGVIGALPTARLAAAPPAPAAVVIPIRDLNLFRYTGILPENVSTAAVSSDGRRLYVGLRDSTRADRLNLAVVTLSPEGQVVGEAHRYADSPIPLPEKTQATVQAILVDGHRRKLYLGLTHQAAKPPALGRLLTVYDLDAAGEPTGAPRAYECGNPHHSVMALARHPRLDRLYLVGFGGSVVSVYPLDARGEPSGEPRVFPTGGGHGKFAVAVSTDGRRLYLGTFGDRLEVMDLDAAGMPVGKARIFQAGPEKGQTGDYLRFQYTPQALVFLRPTPDGPRPAVWPLDAKGDPIGTPKVDPGVSASSLAADPAGRRVWVAADQTFRDAFTGKTVTAGVEARAYTIGADGSLSAETPGVPAPARPYLPPQTGAVLAVGPAGTAVLLTRSLPATPVGNRIRGRKLRVTLLETRLHNGTTPAAVPVWLSVGGKTEAFGDLRPDQPSAWVDLDPYLKDHRGPVLARVSAVVPQPPAAPAPTLPAHLRVRVEVTRGVGSVAEPSVLTETVQGESALVLLPGYGVPHGDDVPGLLSGHAKRYLAAASAVAVPPEDRPRQFVVSCYQLMGGQGHPGQLRDSAAAVAALGFNTVNAYSWGAIPPREVDEVLAANGLRRRLLASYSPPSYFDFDRGKMNPDALARWAAGRAAIVARQNGGTPADVVTHVLSDEPGWYYPAVLNDVRNKPEWLAAFRAYLVEQGLKPLDVGQPDWEHVVPVGRGAAQDLSSRRLYYWSIRFFPDAAARGHRLAREALEKAFGHPLLAPVNWNNWGNRWYTPSPGARISRNRDVGPDTGSGSMDWLAAGRLAAVTPWSEDWFPDQLAENWSFAADLLRAAAPGGQPFGGYVIGATTGEHPAGAQYRILSLVGHGAKAVDVYSWGPEFLFPGNCWSEAWRAYRPVADAIRLVGRGERLLYPGRPERGKAAVLIPGGSALWDSDPRPTHYFHEIWSLHYALTHAGYAVDFVDGIDLASGALAARGYAVLYLTGPNVSAVAQEKVAEWVRDGGTIAVTPGGAVADEYDTPTDRLTGVLGVRGRAAVREPIPGEQTWEALRPTARLTAVDARLDCGDLPLYGPTTTMEPDRATVLARFASGGAAVTLHRHGRGAAVAYGFFPGWQYWLSPDRSNPTRLPRHWGADRRRLAAAPARLAGTPRAVLLSEEVVEGCRLNSEKGVAVVLLNWTDEPIHNLTVTVPGTGQFGKVTSLKHGSLEPVRDGDGLRVKLPVRDVDVLLIE